MFAYDRKVLTSERAAIYKAVLRSKYLPLQCKRKIISPRCGAAEKGL
jgi:hypothetical protein